MKASAKLITIAIIIAAAGVWAYYTFFDAEEVSVSYQMGKVDRGDIRAFVNSTGTVEPLRKVEIGSLISGIVKKVYVDFNSKVKKGDLLVRLDPSPYDAQLNKAKADMARAKAEFSSTETVYESNKKLYEKNLISKYEFDDSIAQYTTSLASVAQAEAALAIADTNLQATLVRSPIDGFVISRRVESGQAISSADSRSTLMTIAEDITKMRVDANVSEADIGRVREGNEVLFRVDAYRDLTFSGKVWQIRNQPVITDNVVTYDVVVLVDNPELKLKPGMTAEVSILVSEKINVLRIPKAAIRFIPPPGSNIIEGDKEIENGSVIWVESDGGVIKPVEIKIGAGNEDYVEVLRGLEEGEEIIITATVTGNTNGESPFGPLKLPQPKRF